MILADVMDDLASALERVPSLTGRTFAYPTDTFTAPAAFVSFPLGTFDVTFERSSDDLEFPTFVVVSMVQPRSARDAMSGYISGDGVESVKAAFEAHSFTACDYAVPQAVEFDSFTSNGIDYLSAEFTVAVTGSGTSS